jgi:hypothetical protein
VCVCGGEVCDVRLDCGHIIDMNNGMWRQTDVVSVMRLGVQGDSHTFFWNAHSSCLTTWHHIISQSTVLPTFTALCISGCMEVGWYSGWCGQKFLVRYSVFHWFEVFEGILVFSSELKHYVKIKGQASNCKLQSVTFSCRKWTDKDYAVSSLFSGV